MLSHLFPSAGEPVADWRGSLGEMVWPGLQYPGGGRGHRRGSLPVLCCLCGSVRCPKAPPGPALLCILHTNPGFYALVDVYPEF